jgi:hypothetical protein
VYVSSSRTVTASSREPDGSQLVVGRIVEAETVVGGQQQDGGRP